MVVNQQLIFRRYQLQINVTDQARFAAEGQYNMTTSLVTEPGTLAMYATHTDQVGTHNVIFELYRDPASYQIHANSPQFKRYGQLAQTVVTKKSIDELHLQHIVSPPAGLMVSGTNTNQVLSLDFTIAPELNTQFETDLASQIAVRKQQLALYTATFVDQTTHWLILLTYLNQHDLANYSDQWLIWLKTYTECIIKTVLDVDTMVMQPDLSD